MGAPRNGFMGDRGPMPTIQPLVRSGPQLGLPGRWWDDGKTVKHLNLRNDQQKKMDEIFNANKGTLQDLFTLARADLEKENAHILMQIRQQMDSEQLNKLDSQIAGLR